MGLPWQEHASVNRPFVGSDIDGIASQSSGQAVLGDPCVCGFTAIKYTAREVPFGSAEDPNEVFTLIGHFIPNLSVLPGFPSETVGTSGSLHSERCKTPAAKRTTRVDHTVRNKRVRSPSENGFRMNARIWGESKKLLAVSRL